MVRVYGGLIPLVLLCLASACILSPRLATSTPPPNPTAQPSSPPEPTPAFMGDFDCYGLEGGVRAYAGRIGFASDGTVNFAGQTGQWTYQAASAAFTFAGTTDLGSATYGASDDTLVAQARAGAAIPHADDGRLDCVRAVPGVTGP